MTINQTLGEYNLKTSPSDGSKIEIEHVPTGNTVTLDQGKVNLQDVLEVDGTQVVGPQQAAVGSLTDNTGGATDGTLAAVSGSGADTAINNNFAELNAKIDAILSALGTAGHGLTGD